MSVPKYSAEEALALEQGTHVLQSLTRDLNTVCLDHSHIYDEERLKKILESTIKKLSRASQGRPLLQQTSNKEVLENFRKSLSSMLALAVLSECSDSMIEKFFKLGADPNRAHIIAGYVFGAPTPTPYNHALIGRGRPRMLIAFLKAGLSFSAFKRSSAPFWYPVSCIEFVGSGKAAGIQAIIFDEMRNMAEVLYYQNCKDVLISDLILFEKYASEVSDVDDPDVGLRTRVRYFAEELRNPSNSRLTYMIRKNFLQLEEGTQCPLNLRQIYYDGRDSLERWREQVIDTIKLRKEAAEKNNRLEPYATLLESLLAPTEPLLLIMDYYYNTFNPVYHQGMHNLHAASFALHQRQEHQEPTYTLVWDNIRANAASSSSKPEGKKQDMKPSA